MSVVNENEPTPIKKRPPVQGDFEIWWKEKFGDPKGATQEMVKSTAYHAWIAAWNHEGAMHTKWVAKKAVSLFEIGVRSEMGVYTNTRAEAAETKNAELEADRAALREALVEINQTMEIAGRKDDPRWGEAFYGLNELLERIPASEPSFTPPILDTPPAA